jgi:hypothetical protein
MLHYAKTLVPKPIKKVIKAAQRALSANSIYDKNYFAYIEDQANAGAKIMAKSLYEWCHPSTVIDVGCGMGALLAAFRALAAMCRASNMRTRPWNIASRAGLPVRKFASHATRLKGFAGTMALAVLNWPSGRLPADGEQ